jgi:hypothetical protein
VGLNSDRLGSGGKFSQTQRRGGEVLAQIQTKVPKPLIQDLPELLSTSGARTPTISVLFLIFIGKDRFK